jgi:SprB repeat
MSAFNYNISVTGDCQSNSTGAISIFYSGGTPPYTTEWIEPIALSADTNPAILSSLSGNTYVLRVNDSTLPINQEFYINIPVSSGVCSSIVSVQGTTCALNNGSVTGTSTSDYSSTNYYLYFADNTYITSATTNTSYVSFGNLTAGTYYMTVEDLGGCSGTTSDFIIEDSEPLSYGLYIVPNSSCGGTPIGKIFVTGVTGHSPYTYLWNTGQSGSTITGLTSGNYSVQVTDNYGCTLTQNAYVADVNPIGLRPFQATQPSCFSSNGAITVQITGGTVPYYYSASTGNIFVGYPQTWTLSGLSAGQYNFQVTDAALCTVVGGTTLVTPQGIASLNISAQGSTCSSSGGSITVSVIGGTTPYVYTLIKPNGDTINVNNTQTTQVFSNLSTGTYTIVVQDAVGCSYMQEVTLFATNTFTISTQTTGTTCNQNNGSVLVTKTSGGTSPYTYTLDGNVSVLNTALSAVTFNNVGGGQHTVTVSDATGCTQTTQVYVGQSVPLDFILYTTSCGNGSSGSLTSFISSGTPPYTFKWSSNVSNNPQQIQVTGLTAGTYSLTVIDSTGCSLKRTSVINCDATYVSYQTYIMGSEKFNVQSLTKYGLLQMLNEGFNNLTSGNTSCSLVSATFGVKVSVNPLGTTTNSNFFTTTSLVNVPTDNQYYDTVKNLLSSISGIGNVTIDDSNNQITIETSPGNTSLNGQEIIVDLTIVYDIMCIS